MLKKLLKKCLADFVYFFYGNGIIDSKLRVKSIDETIEDLLQSEKSLVRFGDGEITMMAGKNLQLEQYQAELADSMKRIIGYQYDDLMVAVNGVFGSLDMFRKESQQFWKDFLLVRRKDFVRLCNTNKVYGNSMISRCYYMFADKSQCAMQFEKIRQIWKDRDVVVVEGVSTHNGVGNDLLDTAKSVERILGPAKNAYLKIEDIYNACIQCPKDKLILVSLGAAAKPLVERLFLQGYRVLDIGNLDMEYEWYLMKANRKMKLAKHEIIGEAANKEAGYDEYLSQIKIVIES